MEEVSIGHQEELVGCLSKGLVVVALIEKPTLGPGGFGRKGNDDLVSQRIQLPAPAVNKGGVGRGVLRKDILKIHIQAGISAILDLTLYIFDQPILHIPIVENHMSQFVRKPTLFRQGGKVHQRGDAHSFGLGDQRLILQIDQRPLGCDPITEGGKICEVWQLPPEQGLVDKRISITIYGQCAPFFALVA